MELIMNQTKFFLKYFFNRNYNNLNSKTQKILNLFVLGLDIFIIYIVFGIIF